MSATTHLQSMHGMTPLSVVVFGANCAAALCEVDCVHSQARLSYSSSSSSSAVYRDVNAEESASFAA